MQTIEITLSASNAEMAEYAAKILKLTVPEVVSFCLKDSTNPKKQDIEKR